MSVQSHMGILKLNKTRRTIRMLLETQEAKVGVVAPKVCRKN